ncbi:hypothetical protein ACFDTO_21250 [Microbacteriaceae bacterium 4G12]
MNVSKRKEIEKQYIVGCVRAILSKDTSCKHLLVWDNGELTYITITEEETKDYHGVLGNNGKEVAYLCIIGKDLIQDFHREAKKEENPIKWLHEAVRYVLENGKRMAAQVYRVDI